VPEVILFTPERIGDDRGWFVESYNARRECRLGVKDVFVQDNQSYSAKMFTVRGIHFQSPPHAQAKLVRCTRGRLRDYVVDLRLGSPTFGEYVEAELSADNGSQIYIPKGFGHAFITMEQSTEISYKVTDFYDKDCDGGIRWNCPDIGIPWPVNQSEATLSAKDLNLPLLNNFESPFEYDGVPLQLRIVS
jgi:dTDP-4-dehydrorhamnose 3,5-epimerase